MPFVAEAFSIMSNKRGSTCPDCGGPHGRSYYTCPKLYANEIIENIDFAAVEARVLALYTDTIGRLVYAALQASHSDSATVRVSVIHDEIVVEVIDP